MLKIRSVLEEGLQQAVRERNLTNYYFNARVSINNNKEKNWLVYTTGNGPPEIIGAFSPSFMAG